VFGKVRLAKHTRSDSMAYILSSTNIYSLRDFLFGWIFSLHLIP
jgi:hypothetical protein